MSIAFKIKEIITDFIKDKYFNYLELKNILLIENNNLREIISNFYNNNSKELKNIVRGKLKNEFQNDYPSMTVENVLFDIFQDSSFNINRIVLEIQNYQESISKLIKLKVFENNLGIKININQFVEIISANNPNKNDNSQDDLYELINNYKYIHSINNTNLSILDPDNKISTIKNFVQNENILDIILVKED